MLVAILSGEGFKFTTGQLTDVATNSYEGQAANYLQKHGIISGFPDGTFRGQKPVNRVEAAKILLLAGNYTLRTIENTGEFPDIEKNSWYEQFALNAVEKSIVNGYPNGTFGPAKPVLRSEFLKMLSRAFVLENAEPFHFEDVPEDAWFSEYAGAAEKYNLLLYDKAQLLPSAPMSREEVAWAVYQMLIHRSYSLVIRTPFDFSFSTPAKTSMVLHAAASSQSSVHSTFAQTSSPQSSASSAAQILKQYCVDSDQTSSFPNGYNIYTQGAAMNLTMNDGQNTFTDLCHTESNRLTEFYCNDAGYLAAEQVVCPFGCASGECIIQPIQESSSNDPRRPTAASATSSTNTAPTSAFASSTASLGCSDTDATHRFYKGENIYTKGTTNGLAQSGERVIATDVCINENALQEFFCSENNIVEELQTNCPQGCTNGACISPGYVGSCADVDQSEMYPDGKDFTRKTRIYVSHPEEGNYTNEDYCTSSTQLTEFYCGENGRVGRYTKRCTCQDGICIDIE